MSYASLGTEEVTTNGASKACPGGYIVRPRGGADTCLPTCPPSWSVSKSGLDQLCVEPAGMTLAEGCPGGYYLTDQSRAQTYCSRFCPSGWIVRAEGDVRYCDGPGAAGVSLGGPAMLLAGAAAVVIGAALYYVYG